MLSEWWKMREIPSQEFESQQLEPLGYCPVESATGTYKGWHWLPLPLSLQGTSLIRECHPP